MFKARDRRLLFVLSTVMTMIAVVLFACLSISWAKYVKENSSSQSSSVANLDFSIGNLEIGDTTYYDLVLEEFAPSEQKTYALNISNGTPESFSEVALLFKFTISKTNNTPLSMTLKNSSDEEVLSLLSADNQKTCDSWIPMAGGSHQEQTFSLVIEWADFHTSHEYANIVDTLSIQIDYEQMD